MPLWREKYPGLEELIESDALKAAVDPYGETYRLAMDQAEARYGLDGVAMQLPYIAANLRRGYKHIEKRLNEYSNLIKADLKLEAVAASSGVDPQSVLQEWVEYSLGGVCHPEQREEMTRLWYTNYKLNERKSRSL